MGASATTQEGRAEIVVVDDERWIRELIARVLEGEYTVVTASNGREGLRCLSPRTRLIITDIRMPGMDGLEYLERIRAARLDLPVLLITGYATSENLLRAKSLQIRHALVKPFHPEELRKKVASILKESRRMAVVPPGAGPGEAPRGADAPGGGAAPPAAAAAEAANAAVTTPRPAEPAVESDDGLPFLASGPGDQALRLQEPVRVDIGVLRLMAGGDEKSFEEGGTVAVRDYFVMDEGVSLDEAKSGFTPDRAFIRAGVALTNAVLRKLDDLDKGRWNQIVEVEFDPAGAVQSVRSAPDVAVRPNGYLAGHFRGELRESLEGKLPFGDVPSWRALASQLPGADLEAVGAALRGVFAHDDAVLLHADLQNAARQKRPGAQAALARARRMGPVAAQLALVELRRRGVEGEALARSLVTVAAAGLFAEIGVVGAVVDDYVEKGDLKSYQTHPGAAARRLAPTGLPPAVAALVRDHHAAVPPSGLGARVLAVADAMAVLDEEAAFLWNGDLVEVVKTRSSVKASLVRLHKHASAGKGYDRQTVETLAQLHEFWDIIDPGYSAEVDKVRAICPHMRLSPSDRNPVTVLCGERAVAQARSQPGCEGAGDDESHYLRGVAYARCLAGHERITALNADWRARRGAAGAGE
ncbi:MAG: response regulator [Planctomycetes bacterium]|nr:response regulator [Planctomycetota bacterium]